MRSLARRSLGAALAVLCACQQPAPPPEDDGFQQRLQAEIEATHARYRTVIEAFWAALAAHQTAAAYALLAPSYRNMVSEESFTRRISRNQNFAHAPAVKVLSTTFQAGTTKVRCVLGELGLGEVTFSDGPAGPRVSGLTIGGTPALPAPE